MNITSLNMSSGDPAIDRALETLVASGIGFEVVERCPVECAFCDESLSHAA